MSIPSQEERVKTAHKVLDPANNEGYMPRLAWLETCPISPPHGMASNSILTMKALPKAIEKVESRAAGQIFEKGKITDVLDKIGFIKFRAVANNTEGQLGAITFSVTLARDLPNAGGRAGLIPCWFLPWSSAKILQISIPDVTTSPQFAPHGYDPIDNPSLFFTAAINGCSVFAYGNPASPRVAHGGLNNRMSDYMKPVYYAALGGNSHAIWKTLLEGVKVDVATDDLVPKAPGDHTHGTSKANRVGGSFGEVHPFQYVSRATATGGTEPITDEADAFERYLQTRRTNHVSSVTIFPFGCVFGMRNDGGAWSFTLQRNVSVEHLRVFKKKATLFSKEKTLNVGPDKHQPHLKFYSALNLGVTRFFPAPGFTHYHAKELIQVY